MTKPKPFCHGAFICARGNVPSVPKVTPWWSVRSLVSAAGVGICGFQLPVAVCVLEGALPVPGSIPAREHTRKVAVAGDCFALLLYILVIVDDVILHLSFVYSF